MNTKSKSPARSDSLVNRLRGIYTVPVNDGAGLLDGKDTYTHQFDGLPPINEEAAKRIEQLERELALANEMHLNETMDESSEITVPPTAVQPIVTPAWHCFHCGFASSDHAEARAHFGDDSDDPAMCVFWATMDDAERAHEYQQMVFELNGTRDEVLSLRQEIRRAEEDGYARGLRDAKRHPEEIGLCRRMETTK